MEEYIHKEHDGPDAEIVNKIKELLDTRVRPAVAQDRGDITFHGNESGIANVIYDYFKLCRAAIVAGDYVLRDEQSAIIKQKDISKNK